MGGKIKTESAAASATKKKTEKSSSSKDKTSKDKDKSSSKDKDSKDKARKKASSASSKPSEATDTETSAAPSPSPSPSPAVEPPLQLDPDAVQLFRRFDRSRSGALSRLDFLALLREYARPRSSPIASRMVGPPQRAPLALTDTNGIPLGYARTDQNSEFEAGQLFERYDKDHAGTLSMAKFHAFFADFRPQLALFASELGYATPMPAPEGRDASAAAAVVDPAGTPSPIQQPDEQQEERQMRAPDLRSEYFAALWDLRKLCQQELMPLQERQTALLSALREEWQACHAAWRTREGPRVEISSRNSVHMTAPRRERQLAAAYEALEQDLERVDEILHFARRQMQQGSIVSTKEARRFLAQVAAMTQDARALAMREYDDIHALLPPPSSDDHGRGDLQSSAAPARSNQVPSPKPEPHAVVTPLPSTTTPQPPPSHDLQELTRQLRIKDQMIYQLLQERSTLRKQKAAADGYLQELTAVSTKEMQKWARLTDEMQAEIQHLRARLQGHPIR